jgi:2-iminobutanoate/2-iminopropanoate deaminase
MKKEAIWPKGGPEPKGPYSPAVVVGDLVFVSGQGPADAKTGEIVRGEISEQMKTTVENIRIILEGAGSSLENVVKVTVYLSDMDKFGEMNELYKEYFGPVYPARTTIQAGRLPLDIDIEIDVIAHRG